MGHRGRRIYGRSREWVVYRVVYSLCSLMWSETVDLRTRPV